VSSPRSKAAISSAVVAWARSARALAEDVAEQRLVLREDPIEDAQELALEVGDLIDEGEAEAGEFAQLEDGPVGDKRRPAAADPHQIGDDPRIAPVGLGLVQAGIPVGVGLERVEDNDFETGLAQERVEGQPVVVGRLQSADARGINLLQARKEFLSADAGVGEAQGFPLLLAGVVEDHGLVGPLADVDPDERHGSPSTSRSDRPEGPRDSTSMPIALWVRRGSPATC
jgi:hypothetical protein